MAKFVPRQRKHKVLARQKGKENDRRIIQDTNKEIIITETSPPENERARLRTELRQAHGPITSKKAKRLEKYIDNKLRKDANRELLAKLAARKVDTSLFTSNRSLGQGRETKKQAISRALKEQRAGFPDAGVNDALYEPRFTETEPQENESSLDDNCISNKCDAQEKADEVQEETAVLPATPLQPIGTGLKRPLELDDEGKPVLRKRQKRGGVKSKTNVVVAQARSDEATECEEWQGLEDDLDLDSLKDKEKPEHVYEPSFTNGNTCKDQRSEATETSEEDSDAGDDSTETSDGDAEVVDHRSSAFKSWAHQRRNEALEYQPAVMISNDLPRPKPDNYRPRAPDQDPLPPELQTTCHTQRKAFSVAVERSADTQEARIKLPIVAEEQKVMEAIHNKNIVIICGPTGSGKTTQVPQFLYEAGFGSSDSPTPGMIGVTQPRRVAAVSMSRRVAEELGDHSEKVAYQIRFEGSVGPKTAIKFMTDGVLLREVSHDITLRAYSAVIIDEAHERSINTDILIGMLSRVVRLRSELANEDATLKPLKLIIMSATLRVEDLTKNSILFPTPPPIIMIEGRQYPVVNHFSRRTTHDYVDEAFRKISRGHRKLPSGGFLVFLTGRNEIVQLIKRLRAAFGGLNFAESAKVRISASEAAVEVEDIDFGDIDHDEGEEADRLLEDKDDDFNIERDPDEDIGPLKMQVLPLFSLLPTSEQLRVFEAPPAGTRQVILATNIAETSLTIPGVRFVFDCGRSKERHYDAVSGVQSYGIGWISKASAEQRSGRAGRVGPGHCYRLYSSAVYERDFALFTEPELLRMPIEGVVLQLKAMRIQSVVNFPFLTPPDRGGLANAERLLRNLGALSAEGQITDIGKTMALFPLAPRFARILLVGHMHDCLPYTIAMVAGLSVAEVFLPEHQAVPTLVARDEQAIRTNADVVAETQQATKRRRFNEVHQNFCFLDDKSDAIKLLQVVGEFAHEPTEQWCENHFVRYKVLREVQQLRRQITELMRVNLPRFSRLAFQDKLEPPSPKQVSALKQMVAAGFIDQVAIRADLSPNPPEQQRKSRRAIDVPYVPLVPLRDGQDVKMDGSVHIHPASPLAHLSAQECPEYVVYSHLQRASTLSMDTSKKPKIRMQSLTDIKGAQCYGLAKGTPLLSYGKPIKEINLPSHSDARDSRVCWVVPYLRSEERGSQGWPLPAAKVKQTRQPGKGWVVV